MSLATMARKSRIDAPVALHHIIVRGIKRRSIISDARDYQNFLERPGHLLTDSAARWPPFMLFLLGYFLQFLRLFASAFLFSKLLIRYFFFQWGRTENN